MLALNHPAVLQWLALPWKIQWSMSHGLTNFNCSEARNPRALQFCDTNPSPANQRGGTTCSIIWQGNPISVVKPFATKNCALCAKERLAILKQSRSNPQLLIKSNNEACGACRHRPCFRRHAKQPPALMSQSMTKDPAQHTKLPQILLGALFACLMSNWKHCEDQQKEIIFYFFPEH